MSADRVEDAETLFRRVPPRFCEFSDDAPPRPRLDAFYDRENRPSVDRPARGATPERSRQSSENGVLSLVAGDIRSLTAVPVKDERGGVIGAHGFEVEPDPLPDNPAHAVIAATPALPPRPRRLRERWCESLARLAAVRPWLLLPQAPKGADVGEPPEE